MKNTRSLIFFSGFVALFTFVATTCAIEWWPFGKKTEQSAAPVIVDATPVARDTKMVQSFAPIVKQVAPTVVNVFTSKTVKETMDPRMSPFFNDPFFRHFFGEPDNNNNDQGNAHPRSRQRKEQSLGSGVIATKDGYIITNNHVVDAADEVKVALNKGSKEYIAKVVGKDPKTDIAVLKIDAPSDLQAITFGDSDKIEVGDVVLAVGNPFGIGQTVTSGIVSAVGRNNLNIEDYENFIQTDAAINPGNSGGALVDAQGRLIGINTAIFSRSGGNQGIGFAIPVNMVKYIMEQILKNKGKVVRGYLGVKIQDLTPELAQQFNVPDSVSGALIGEVVADGPGAKAGLKEGDVITALNGNKVDDGRSLRLAVSQIPPGTKVTLKVIREGKEKSIDVVLAELKPEKLATDDQDDQGGTTGDALDGIEVGDIDNAARQQLKVPADVKGALVTSVDPSSPAAETIHEGDIIQEIDHQEVKNAKEAIDIGKKTKKDRILLRVWSRGGGGGSHYVVINRAK